MHRRRGPKGPRRFFVSPSARPKAHMRYRERPDLRHDPARWRAGSRQQSLPRGEAATGPAARRAGGGRHRGRAFRPHPRATSGACSEIAAEMRRPVIAALARCHERDIELAGEAIRPAARGRIHVFISTSDLHIREKLRTTREDVLARVARSDPARAELHRRRRVLGRGCEPHRSRLPLPGGRGGHRGGCDHDQPPRHGRLRHARGVRRDVPRRAGAGCRARGGVVLSAHCHDDLGLAVANSLAAIGAGARQVECTINGIGERAGNAALEEIVMAGQRARAARSTSAATSRRARSTAPASCSPTSPAAFPQPNKAIVGRNAFAHEAGIHQHGMLQNGLTYEIIRPEMVGIPRSTLVLGKHSGRHALERRFQRAGLRSRGSAAGRGLPAVHCAGRPQARDPRRGSPRAAARELPRRARGVPAQPPARGLRQRASDRRSADGGSLGGRARVPAGPATARSRRRSPRSARSWAGTIEVLSLSLRSVTPGATAWARCFSRPRWTASRSAGNSASTDIVEASARALVHALNKARHADRLEGGALNSVYLWGV